MDKLTKNESKEGFMETKALKATCLTLAILVWAVFIVAADLNLWKEHGYVIDAGGECTRAIETK